MVLKCSRRTLTSAGAACRRAIAAFNPCLQVMNNWKALPVQLKPGGNLEKFVDSFYDDCHQAVHALGSASGRLDNDDVNALTRLLAKVRALRIRTDANDPRSRVASERWRDLHADLNMIASRAALVQHSWQSLLRLLLELCARDVPEPLPPVTSIDAALRNLLALHLRGHAHIPAAHTAALIGALNWREDLRACSAMAAGILSTAPAEQLLACPSSFVDSLSVSPAGPPYALVRALLSACGTAQVRSEPLFLRLVAIARKALQAGLWSPRETTSVLTRIVSVCRPVGSGSPAVVVGLPLTCVAGAPSDDAVTDLLAAVAAALGPTMISLQYRRYNVQRDVNRQDSDLDDEDGDAVDENVRDSGSSWTLRQVVALLSVYAYAGEPGAAAHPWHRSFLEQLVSTIVSLMDSEPSLLPESTAACSQFYYALRMLEPTHVGPRLRGLVPQPLWRLCATAFTGSIPPALVSYGQERVGALLDSESSRGGGQWLREWVVPEVGNSVDFALPDKRVLLQVDGPSHFALHRSRGDADASVDRARMLAILDRSAKDPPPGGMWGTTIAVLEAGGFEARYGIRAVKQDLLLGHLGYTVLRIPYQTLEHLGKDQAAEIHRALSAVLGQESGGRSTGVAKGSVP